MLPALHCQTPSQPTIAPQCAAMLTDQNTTYTSLLYAIGRITFMMTYAQKEYAGIFIWLEIT